MTRLTIAIFSYNRGNYLRNCLDSVLRHAPDARIALYDDASDEAETLALLGEHASLCIETTQGAQSKHGGLYANMQRALDDCSTDYLFFLQDDMQMLRRLTDRDLTDLDQIFASDPKIGFVCPTFMKGGNLTNLVQVLHRDPHLPAFTRPRSVGSNGYVYADVSLAHVARLRAANWQFANRERLNVEQAAIRFSQMPFLARPFVFFCPEVPVFRGRTSTLASRLAARICGTDVKAFHDLTLEQVATQGGADLPIAEEHLRPMNPAVRRPFVYQDIKARPWLALLHRLELALRKFVPRR